MVLVLACLGSHWATVREAGEAQLTFNYIRAITDYHINFCFSRGVTFKTPRSTSGIVPGILNRVWTVDNNREALMWEMGQMGGVTGDVFVKVAYEEPSMWPPMEPAAPIPGVRQSYRPGRCRILVLNSSYCFPIWNPHDREKLIQFTQKYRYWAPAADGTRQMKVYVEVITDTEIREYVDDVLISEPRPNPLGMIPVVHIANRTIAGSPWGLPDCHDIIHLNRAYNETATMIMDIINYYTEPVTVLVGANQNTLQRGTHNIWSVPKGVEVNNLDGGQEGINGALAILNKIELDMYALANIPEGALGRQQPVSNTAGVALAIQYQPTIMLFDQKKINYGRGVVNINEIVLRTLALKEPELARWGNLSNETAQPDQLEVLDWDDPVTYITECHWPNPLPIDTQRVLLEQQQKMALGLQSKRGALAELGEEFPADKAAEIYRELVGDMLDQAALDFLRAQAQAVIMETTGMLPPDGEPAVQSAGGPNVDTAGAAGSGGGASGGGEGGGQPGRPALSVTDSAEGRQIQAEIQARIMGTKLAGIRLPTEISTM